MKKNKKHYRSRARQPVNQKHKDRLFRFIFQNKKDLLELYNAVNGTDYQDPEELIITTLEDALFLGVKNDLSFIIGDSLNLYEHQSSWNANMPLRGLFYFASLYQQFVEQNGYNLYGSRQIELPLPQYLVFYNGDRTEPDQQELTLAEAFRKTDREQIPSVDCRVRVLNINQGHNRELMEKCRRLWEYAEFIGQVKSNLKKGMHIRDAVKTSMNDCRDRGILVDILSRCQTEVLTMLLTEYDEKKTREYLRKEAWETGLEAGKKAGKKAGREEGIKEGREEGENRVNELVRRLIADNRFEDLKHSSEDKNFQKKLFQEYGIE